MGEPALQPPAVRRAGFLVAAEGLVGLIAAVVLVVRGIGGAKEGIVNGFATAGWLLVVCGAVLAAGWALITGRRWGRGLAVFFNLLLLGVAWFVFRSGQLSYAIAVTVVAALTLGLLFSPSAVQWMSKRD